MENQISPVMDKKVATKLRICKYLEEGMCFKDACISAGITERTGHRWKNADVSFVSQLEASEAKYIEKLIKCVNREALKDGKIALQVLRIRRPETWNPMNRVRVADPQEELRKIKELIYGRNENHIINMV